MPLPSSWWLRALLTSVDQPFHPVLEGPQPAVTLPRVPLQEQLLQPHQGFEGRSVERGHPVAGQRQPGEPGDWLQQASGQPQEAVAGQVKASQLPQAAKCVLGQALVPQLHAVGVRGRGLHPQVVGREVEPVKAA